MNFRILIMSAAMALTTGAVWAKLPPPSEEAKAKAAEAKAKADDAAKKDAELLTRAQERAVANFKKNRAAMAGKK
jgi:poly-gamma-glutamate capsule biosynthesis protein CapA/YwtB (metallophosphatase superfamily)